MDRKQLYPIWYFIGALLVLLLIQSLFQKPLAEHISYSQFKSLLNSGRITDLVVGEKIIRGSVGAGGADVRLW